MTTTKRHIAIEAQRIFRTNKHGMDFVALETIRELQKRDDGNHYYVFVAPGEDRCLTESANLTIVELPTSNYLLWEQIALPRALKKYPIDLLHCTSNTAPLYCSVPLVLTLHDIIYLGKDKTKGMSMYQQIGWYYRKWLVPHIIKKCKHIITVSHTEENNILQRFPGISSKLSVNYNGFSSCYKVIEKGETENIKKYLSDDNYLFFLGNTDPRKNTKRVLQAYYYYLQHSQKKCKLIVTGISKEYAIQLLTELDIMSCLPDLIFTGYISGKDLPALYNRAFVFLFPSIKEGFGIPILEAMACGTPIITSNTSAMPEVAGTGTQLIDPYKPEEIANAILRLEQDEAFYQSQVSYGLERVKQFSWKHTADKLSQIYQKIGR